jgi:AcrR family transcriptional regulator
MEEKAPNLRERRAQLTRAEILGAARRLFAERGYARTSVRDIATAAGVSAQTVYDSVGPKQALVAGLNDLIDVEAGIVAIAMSAAAAQDPVEVVGVPARITRSILEHCGDVIHALVGGAAAEPELDAVLAEGKRRHVEGVGRMIGKLQQLDALGPDLDAAQVADTMAVLTDVRVALLLQESYGWSLDRIESWMADSCRTLVLGPD